MATTSVIKPKTLLYFQKILPDYVEMTMNHEIGRERTGIVFTLPLYIHPARTPKSRFIPNPIYCAIEVPDFVSMEFTKEFGKRTIQQFRDFIKKGEWQETIYKPKTDDFTYRTRKFNNWFVVKDGNGFKPEELIG
jgi:hypothetical protein